MYPINAVDGSRDNILQVYDKAGRSNKKWGRKDWWQIHIILAIWQISWLGISEPPNDEAPMQFGLNVGSLGNIRAIKLRAFRRKKLQVWLISLAD